MAAKAGFGAARELATDARNARLHLDPTAAVAIRYTSDKDLEVVPDPAGGEHLLRRPPWWHACRSAVSGVLSFGWHEAIFRALSSLNHPAFEPYRQAISLYKVRG